MTDRNTFDNQLACTELFIREYRDNMNRDLTKMEDLRDFINDVTSHMVHSFQMAQIVQAAFEVPEIKEMVDQEIETLLKESKRKPN